MPHPDTPICKDFYLKVLALESWFLALNLKHMKKNMGKIDRLIRVIIAILIVIGYFLEAIDGTFALILLAFSAIFIFTSAISFCPLYAPFGLKTCKKEEG